MHDLTAWFSGISTILLAIHWILGTIHDLTGSKTVDGIDGLVAKLLTTVFHKDTTLPKP